VRRLVALVLASGVLVACGDAPAVQPASEPRFDTRQVAWAHLRTLHYGDRDFSLPRRIRGLAVSSYGSSSSSPTGTTSTARRGGGSDKDGPLRPAGRIRQIVVADVRLGEAVLKDHSGMGGGLGDDLGDRYEELSPEFLGFDEAGEHAYWRDASGHGTRKRAALASGEIDDAEPRDDGDGTQEAVSPVVDAYRGRQAAPAEVGGPVELQYGLYSPDRRWAVDVSAPGHTLVFDARTGKRIRVAYPQRAHYFAGWLPGDRFYVVSAARRVQSYSLTGPDRTRGRISVCALPTGTCHDGARVPGLRDLVVPGSPSLLG
jgi:hypothetical protein